MAVIAIFGRRPISASRLPELFAFLVKLQLSPAMPRSS